MTGGPGPVVCWNCAQPWADGDTCRWCGVWLVDLDPDHVPPAARPILALARRWGIPDDGYRWAAIARASRVELEAIVLSMHDDAAHEEIQCWLIGPEADAAPPSREYVAITCLTMAADQARFHLAQRLRASSATCVEPDAEPQHRDGTAAMWSLELLNALRLGRRLVAEVPAGPGRRAFVDITPVTDDRDRLARQEGWQRPDPNRSFQLQHWDYDEQMIDGWDYDVGAVQARSAHAHNEAELLVLVADWGLLPTDFTYPWKTADPK